MSNRFIVGIVTKYLADGEGKREKNRTGYIFYQTSNCTHHHY